MTKKDGLISSIEAAKLLGVSTGTVQRMVDKGELAAWTTQGGHRRIYKESVEKELALRKGSKSTAQGQRASNGVVGESELDLVLAHSTMAEAQKLETTVQKWGIPLTTEVADDPMALAFLCASKHPRIVAMHVDEPKDADLTAFGKLNEFLQAQGTELVILTSKASLEAVTEALAPWNPLVFVRTPGLEELRGFVRGNLRRR
ncbi:hypothetical protein LMG31506_03018 [Cupriavidus yeoncheonensis]|uniref:Helix-turn-helix domain-containing protein n=1 Tax=Cupriavidus yeoncheonensis TaxID=1462994 RepID=A0A916IVV6_9BURK|nr:excisionase family DNA-binding protein [Cupriavidus yeoncheonensis]CAG2144492.1 hypothetical protein LMG31506_03018 [Cupriavidus yeoncheonensis]